MPVTITTGAIKYKSPTTGEYVGVSAVAERTAAEMQAAVNAAGADRLNEINTRAVEIKAGLPKTGEIEDMVAEVFSESKNYEAGDYCIYNLGNVDRLYRFKAPHAAGEWVGNDAEEVKLANDVSNLESALNASASEETAQEMLAALLSETGLTDIALTVIGMTIDAMPSDEVAQEIRDAISLEATRLEAIFDLWLAEKESA